MTSTLNGPRQSNTVSTTTQSPGRETTEQSQEHTEQSQETTEQSQETTEQPPTTKSATNIYKSPTERCECIKTGDDVLKWIGICYLILTGFHLILAFFCKRSRCLLCKVGKLCKRRT